MPNILPKKKMHHFWVNKTFGGDFGGPKWKKMAFLSIFENFDPRKHPPIYFLTEIDTLLKPHNQTSLYIDS